MKKRKRKTKLKKWYLSKSDFKSIPWSNWFTAFADTLTDIEIENGVVDALRRITPVHHMTTKEGGANMYIEMSPEDMTLFLLRLKRANY